ncbi:MAG: ABC transporter permease [Bryobacteraceae bacterium]
MGKILRRIHYLLHREKLECELEEELAAHRAMMPEDRRTQFGNTLQLRERSRDSWGWVWMDDLGKDVTYGLRGLWRDRRFALSVLAALVLSIGAATAVFSVVDRSLFRPLPYFRGDRLVSVSLTMPALDTGGVMFYGAYQDWKQSQKALDLTSWSGVVACDVGGNSPQRLNCARMESTFLPALGVRPALGRNFAPEEDRKEGVPVALISHGFWAVQSGSGQDVLGKRISVDGVSTQIIGVLPSDFETPDLTSAQVFLPQKLPQQRGRNIMIGVAGRLQRGYSLEGARTELQSPLEQFRADFAARVGANFAREMKLQVVPLRDQQIQRYKVALWMLLAAVAGFVLIACANVTNLLLARSAARRAEFALRAALGASRTRLLRQALTESGLLSFVGGALGCALAWWLLRVFISLAPEGTIRLKDAALDLRVLTFTLALSAGAALTLGLAPMLDGSLWEALSSGRINRFRKGWLRPILVTLQVSISFLLLIGAGLFVTSLWKLQNTPIGINPEHVVTASFTLPAYRYSTDEQQLAFFAQLGDRLRAMPGAGAVALTDSLPPGPAPRTVPYAGLVNPGGNARDPGMSGNVQWRWVSPGYFESLGITILRGRSFAEEDREPGASNVVINETLARRVFGGDDPIGKRVGRSIVVGVAADVRNLGPDQAPNPEFYRVRKTSRAGMAGSSDPAWPRRATAIVRTRVNRKFAEQSLGNALRAIDASVPFKMETMESQVGQFYTQARFQTTLLFLFALVGLGLAGIGIYGLVAFLVAERTREIGVRIALGATRGEIARLVVSNTARWSFVGLTIGLMGSLFSSRLLRGLLYEVHALDSRVYAAAMTLLGIIAVLAAWLPARRAARIDPMIALRHE